jgi:hypothetical protein
VQHAGSTDELRQVLSRKRRNEKWQRHRQLW